MENNAALKKGFMPNDIKRVSVWFTWIYCISMYPSKMLLKKKKELKDLESQN